MVGMLGLVIFIWAGSYGMRAQYVHTPPTLTPTSTPTALPSTTYTPPPTSAPTQTEVLPTATITPTATLDPLTADTGYLLLAMSDGYYSHLFAYHPQSLPLTRLTDNPWDDRQPAISPDGTKIAFSSRRNGYWDIYILSLTDGVLSRVSDSPQYDGAPTWSPDGQWLAYETYVEENLEIVIQSVSDPTQAPFRLTNDPAADYSPKWSPLGRQIAFVSTTSGEEEIWLANLDRVENRFSNFSQNKTAIDGYPDWSPDGRYLAWTSQQDGLDNLYVRENTIPASPARLIGTGRSAAWSPDGSVLAAVLLTPDQNALVAYRMNDGRVGLPPVELPAAIQGIDWSAGALPELIRDRFVSGAGAIPPILYQKNLSNPGEDALGRLNLVNVEGVSAPYPLLQDSADESFITLRVEAARQTGWDLLGDLENLFLPITEPAHPGLVDEWLFTGRGLALHTSALQAGWMQIVRENFGGMTYWRVWVRTRYQDGSQGEPLHARPWNLDARSSGDPRSFEEGGRTDNTPAGYWIDFTELAARFGWKPLPALSNWRTYYPAARINQFVFSEGLDWETAMAQIYPQEAVHQPTAASSQIYPLFSPTATLSYTIPDISQPEGPTATFRPTWTPLPED